jgi:hypothetical protein
MESHFNHDFSRVRVHADGKSAESAWAINSLAYTAGQDVVFAAGRYEPRSEEGRRLLAHELTHVVQQGGRAEGGPLTLGEADSPAERVADNIASGVHVAGGGDASRAIAPLSAPQIQREPQFQLHMPQYHPPFQSPVSTPGFDLKLAFHLQPDDKAKIDQFLAKHGLGANALFQPVLDGRPVTIKDIFSAVQPLVFPLVSQEEVEAYLRGKVVVAMIGAFRQVKPALPPLSIPNIFAPVPASADAGQGARAQPDTTFTVGYSYAWHVAVGGEVQQPDRTLQLQIGEDAPLQRIFQISYNRDNGQVQVVVGGQATGDITLVENLLKLSGFVQILAGVAWTGSPASGTFAIVQPSVGGQLTLSFGPVQLAVQAGASITAAQGQPTTLDANITPQATLTFPLDLSKPKKRGPSPSELTGMFEMLEWVERAAYSEIERMPTGEKKRYISTFLGEHVTSRDFEAVARIWRSLDAAGERAELRRFIDERIPGVADTAVQGKLRALIREDNSLPAPAPQQRNDILEPRYRRRVVL